MTRPADESRIEPRLIAMALRRAKKAMARKGNSGQPPDGIEGRVVSDVDLNTGKRTTQDALDKE